MGQDCRELLVAVVVAKLVVYFTAIFEATVVQCCLYVRKFRWKINFHSFFLHMCNFCCTFAG